MLTVHCSLYTVHSRQWRQFRPGFTLIELLLVMAIFAIVVGFATINLIRPQISASLDSTATTLTADIKEQQIKSMVGDSNNSHGIHFENDKYILFAASYSPSNPANFAVNLDSSLSFTSFPAEITFERLSGETSQSAITLTHNQSGDQKTISINILGAITIN